MKRSSTTIHWGTFNWCYLSSDINLRVIFYFPFSLNHSGIRGSGMQNRLGIYSIARVSTLKGPTHLLLLVEEPCSYEPPSTKKETKLSRE